MREINIVLLTDIAILSNLLSNYLEKENIKVIGTFNNIGILCESLKKNDIEPDIIIICTNPFDLNLHHAIAINEIKPGMKYIVISNIPENDFFIQGLSVGIKGWIDPEIEISYLIATIKIVAGGGISIGYSKSMDFINKILEINRKSANNYHAKNISAFDQDETFKMAGIDLTTREIEILTLIAEGTTNKKISEMLFISENTVKTHVRNILSKLQFQSRTQVALYAIKHGMLNNK